MNNYYKSQLNYLENSEYYKTIELSDGQGNKTNNLNLNEQSIPELIKFLNKELKRLKRGESK